MSLTFQSPPRISEQEFERVLSRFHSPVAAIAAECYRIITAAGLDPAVALAFVGKESTFLTRGRSVQWNNWGNMRLAHDKTLANPPVAGLNFATYPSIQNSLKDWTIHIKARYVARGLNDVDAAIAVYAPAFENDVDQYRSFVRDHVAQWIAEDQQPMSTTTGYADRTALISLIQPSELPGPVNRTGDKLTASRSFTVHETANENAGATAAVHKKYWDFGGGGRLISSAHVVADAVESIQLIPTDEQAWHAGDVEGNQTSVGGEICVNDRAGFPVACRRMAKVVARWLRSVGLQPLDGVTVRKHGSWPGTTHKQCPLHLNKGDWGVTWIQFVQMVTSEYNALATLDFPKLWGTNFPYHPTFGIETEWRRAAVTLGAATSDEHSDSAGMVTRHFVGGYVRYDPKTNTCTSFFARPV